jgi:hypothetical protein
VSIVPHSIIITSSEVDRCGAIAFIVGIQQQQTASEKAIDLVLYTMNTLGVLWGPLSPSKMDLAPLYERQRKPFQKHVLLLYIQNQ